MKRLIAVLSLCLVSGTLLFAFGQSEKSSDPNAPVTLSVYMQMDLANPQSAYWPETVKAFEEKYPNIKLEFEYVSGEAFHDKFQIMAASGDIPDVFTTYGSSRSGYVIDRGMVKDLRPYLTKELKSKYDPTIWNPQGPKGEIYIISPNLAVCTVVYINPKLQKKLGLSTPKTLDEMIAQVPAIRKAGLTPLAFANKGQWQAQSLLLSMLTDRMGGVKWFDKAIAGKAKFSDKPFVDAISVIKKMTDAKLFPAGVNQLEGTAAWGEFVADKAVYLLDAGWRISALKKAAKPEDFAQYKLMAFPSIDGEVTKGSSAATTGESFGMNAKLKGAKEDAALKFIAFMSGKEASEILTKYGTTTTYKVDLSKMEIDPLTKQYAELIRNQSMGYVIDAKMDSEGVNNLLNPGIQAVMMGNKTPEQLAKEYEAWVAENDSHRKK